MPRQPTINQDAVSMACDALDASGVVPTHRAVRKKLETTASESTLGPMIAAWRQSAAIATREFSQLDEAEQLSAKRLIGTIAGSIRSRCEKEAEQKVAELRIVANELERDAEADRQLIAEQEDALAKSEANAEQLLADLRQAESRLAAAEARIAMLEKSVTTQTERGDAAHKQVVELVGQLGKRVQEQLELTMDD